MDGAASGSVSRQRAMATNVVRQDNGEVVPAEGAEEAGSGPSETHTLTTPAPPATPAPPTTPPTIPAKAATGETVPAKDRSIEYTDVVIIGNGPSGICLSYLLSGHWPYYTGAPHPNEDLQLRLGTGGGQQALVEQDLEFLSSGLEGRSANPVALLFDALTHPEADMGLESDSLLAWTEHPDRVIPHVVLGRKAEGGAWQMMDGQLQTLSLGNWMQLPDLPFRQWLEDYRSQQKRANSDGGGPVRCQKNRATMEEVRHYYMEYVRRKGLLPHFRNYSTVTSVERVLDVSHSVDDESGEQRPCNRDHSGRLTWEVRGQQTLTDHHGNAEVVNFCYRSPNVVLATGSYDLPNRLKVPGEKMPYILHSLAELESVIRSGKLAPDSDPLVVIGAGLSAADAILCAMDSGIPVAHVFRRDVEDPQLVFRQLPALLYPEYHRVLQMMRQGEADGAYEAFATHAISEFMGDGNILMRGQKSGCDTILKASYVVILIGSRPDLSFLPQDGKNLGIVPGMSVDCKRNPLDVDMYTYQSVYECGLYAMGPLVGDNFVRFLRGGALGIASHMWRKRHGKL